jgi:hypothetical protein
MSRVRAQARRAAARADVPADGGGGTSKSAESRRSWDCPAERLPEWMAGSTACTSATILLVAAPVSTMVMSTNTRLEACSKLDRPICRTYFGLDLRLGHRTIPRISPMNRDSASYRQCGLHRTRMVVGRLGPIQRSQRCGKLLRFGPAGFLQCSELARVSSLSSRWSHIYR